MQHVADDGMYRPGYASDLVRPHEPLLSKSKLSPTASHKINPPRLVASLINPLTFFDDVIRYTMSAPDLRHRIDIATTTPYDVEQALAGVLREAVDGEIRLYRGMDVPVDWDGEGSLGTYWSTSILYVNSHHGIEEGHAILTADAPLSSINWVATAAYWLDPIEDEVLVSYKAPLTVEHIRLKRHGQTIDLIVAPHGAYA